MADAEDIQRLNLNWVKEYGSKQIALEAQELPFGLSKTGLSMEKLFKWNMMTQTEGVNRIVSSYSGHMMFQQTLGAYKGQAAKGFIDAVSRTPAGGKKEIERTWREVWKLSNEEISFLKNTKFEKLREGDVNKKMMDWIALKVQHFSHVSTQGSTSVSLLPRWMSGQYARPLTLFQRMAWSTTTDIVQNYIKPIKKTGNAFPLMRAMIGHNLSGAALYWTYDLLFKQEKPMQMNQDKLARLMPNIWRSEFFGLFGEVFNPHTSPLYQKNFSIEKMFSGDAVTARSLIEPVIIRNSLNLYENVPIALSALWSKHPTKFWHQAMADIGNNSIVMMGQLSRIKDNIASSHHVSHTRFKVINKEFMREKGYDGRPRIVMNHARTPYYKDLKSSFWKGNKSEWTRTYWNAYNYLVTDLMVNQNFTEIGAHKQALQTIESSLKSMNPIPHTFSKEGKTISRKKEYLKWLKERDINKYNEIIKLEKEYEYNLRQFYRTVRSQGNINRYSVYLNRGPGYNPKFFGTF